MRLAAIPEQGNAAQEDIPSCLTGSLVALQELAGSSAAGRVQMDEEVDALQLNRPVTLAELRRHKRVFLKMSTQSLASRLPDRQSARRMFVNYLREHLD